MLFHVHRERPSLEQENHYWISFSDMMSGMLIIFILVCITLLYKLSQMVDLLESNMNELNVSTTKKTNILDEVFDKLKNSGIQVIIDHEQSILRIPEDTLNFSSNRYEINSKFRKNAEKIGRALFEAIKYDDRWQNLDTVFIEGHTDSLNAPDYIMGNWQLSTFRAISLWKFWTEETDYGAELAELKNKDNKYLFSVSGYSSTRRIEEPDDTDEKRLKNRRIDIRFTVKQPTSIEIKEIINSVK